MNTYIAPSGSSPTVREGESHQLYSHQEPSLTVGLLPSWESAQSPDY